MDKESIRSLWSKGLDQFNAGKFFECHETLEKIWLALEEGESKRFIQGIIHLAVSHYHFQNDNLIGMELQREKALRKLQTINRERLSFLFNCDVEKTLESLKQKKGEGV